MSKQVEFQSIIEPQVVSNISQIQQRSVFHAHQHEASAAEALNMLLIFDI